MIVKQFRYYADNDTTYNYPTDLTKEILYNGELLIDYDSVIQLGIQALPGTKFILNDNIKSEIVINETGIYDLELNSKVSINSLRFDENSLEIIEKTENAILIIDILAEEEDD